MVDKVDYLVLGSGLSSLSFSALMAKAGRSVKILEAHEYFGGYGHTFTEGDYKFNAHLHYVQACREEELVYEFLQRLGLEKQVRFNLLDPEGFDRVYCDGKQLNIPYKLENLQKNMVSLLPTATPEINKFIDILIDFRQASAAFPLDFSQIKKVMKSLPSCMRLTKYKSATLQEVFDACRLPKILQTLVSGQLLDYLLPPRELSFFVWAALFNSYSRGAYYPVNHYESVVDAIVSSIREHNGKLTPNEQVVEFILEGNSVKGVYTRSVNPKTGICDGPKKKHLGQCIICNFDPKQAAQLIGMEKFSRGVRRKLDYDYSYSSFAAYCVVKDIDLQNYGFGSWNIWHCQPDHNIAFDAMYKNHDYSKPYFAMNSNSLHTDNKSNCPQQGQQIFQMLTVANYDYWRMLKLRDRRTYNSKKKEVLSHLLDVVEEHYIPNIRQHLVFHMTGSPTTNERYVFAPRGGAYGVNLTPRNFSLSRKLTSHSSLKNFYFCSAAAGFGGFSGTIWTGLKLYEKLK